MLKTLRNAWKIADLRKKLLFTALILLVYRFGAVLPVPFIDAQAMSESMSTASAMSGTLFGYMNILSGQALSQGTLFALGVSPYITASIVLQLWGIAFPKHGEKFKDNKELLNTWTRIVTVALAILTAVGYYLYLKKSGMLQAFGKEVLGGIVIVACFCAGAAIVMWLGELINERGIGNGISMILFANILAGSQALIATCYSLFMQPHWGWKVYTIGVLLFSIAAVVFVVFITNSERRLPVEYAKRVVGRKMMGGQRTTLPIKLNMTGVMPIIFASALVSLPQTIQMIVAARIKEDGFWDKFFWLFSYESPLYAALFFVLIVAFAYFYVSISFNPNDVANNLQQNGGFIKGYRPGKPTAGYITKVLNRVTLMGALFLSVIAVVPLIANLVVTAITDTAAGQLVSLAFGGSSLLIVVGVILETGREIEAQMTMRHYKGFLE